MYRPHLLFCVFFVTSAICTVSIEFERLLYTYRYWFQVRYLLYCDGQMDYFRGYILGTIFKAIQIASFPFPPFCFF